MTPLIITPEMEAAFDARRAALKARADGLITITVHPAVVKLAAQFKAAKRR